MICLYGETHLSTVAAIFYSCICAVVRFCRFLLDPHHQPESSYSGENPDWELDLPVSQFRELQEIDEGEMCSICLVEMEGEDSVNKLPECGHVFHAECMDKWLDRCNFTCPLCRSSVLRVRSSPPCSSSSSAPPFCFDLSHDYHSN